MKFALYVLVVSFLALSCNSCDSKSPVGEYATDSLDLKFTVLSILPHNAQAFTEGLVMYGDRLLESTGLNNQSWIAEVNIASGAHTKKIVLDGRYFGEGITVLNNKIYQLTYQEKTGFIYHASSFSKIGEFVYNTEGWGLTHDNKDLIMSDGSHKLYFVDTTNHKVIRTLHVTGSAGERIKNLNELEYVDGFIFANVHETSRIVKIDPRSGKVIGRLELGTITNEVKRTYANAGELNGIAYDRNNKALLVTGKFWPKAYLIRL